MRRSRSPFRFLRKRRQLRRLPLWAVLFLLGWVAALTWLDRDSAPTSGTLPSARASVATVPSGRFKAHVVRVADGDTLSAQTTDGQHIKVSAQTTDGQHIKVRLAHIDAPETDHGAKPETDRYQRHVCWVYAEGVNVNLEQVKRGMAWVYRPPRVSRRERRALSPLVDAQDMVRRAGRGMWIDADPTAPWDWRRDCWQAGKCR